MKHFGNSIQLHAYSQDTEQFYNRKKNSHVLLHSVSYSILGLRQLLRIFSHIIGMPLITFHTNEIFSIVLLLLQHKAFEIPLCYCIYQLYYSFMLIDCFPWYYVHYTIICLFIYRFLNSFCFHFEAVLNDVSVITPVHIFAKAYISLFFPYIFISWSLITLQYCSGFCHTLT